ncbi:MAG: hypothetical protein ACI8TP_000945 [Acidimicrobiales bacterium]|jgi:hypothetical protein
MGIVNTVRAKTTTLLEGGKERARAARVDRARSHLFRELGQLCYDQRHGIAGAEFDIERVIALIDESASPTSSVTEPDIDLVATPVDAGELSDDKATDSSQRS